MKNETIACDNNGFSTFSKVYYLISENAHNLIVFAFLEFKEKAYPVERVMFRVRSLNIKVGTCVPVVIQGQARGFLFKSSSKPVTDEEIVNASNWKDSSPFRKLGMKPWHFSQENLKRHHKVLARHFHPDAGNDPSGQAFVAIQEAYESLSTKKPQNEGEDFQGRRAQVRFMGSSVNFFLFGTMVFIFFIAYRNRKRLGKSHIEYCVAMFLVLQLVPRLLASAIIFSYVSGLLMERNEALARSKAMLIVEKTSSKSLKLRIEGISDDEWQRTNIEVVIYGGKPDGATQTPTQSSHLKFDKGIREVDIPVVSNESPSGGMDVFAVRDDIKILVASKFCPS